MCCSLWKGMYNIKSVLQNEKEYANTNEFQASDRAMSVEYTEED